MGGSAPLAALLAGMLLKQMHPRPWAWPRQLGSASSMLTMLMFVLVSTVAAQADWNAPVVGVVLALILVRLLAKAVGVGLGNVGSGASWRQALWVGLAMTPMSAIALLIASQFAMASPSTGHLIAGVAPAGHFAHGGAGRHPGHRGHLPHGRELQALVGSSGTQPPRRRQQWRLRPSTIPRR
jgi:Kef-type K+ transport system membrane component KefB